MSKKPAARKAVNKKLQQKQAAKLSVETLQVTERLCVDDGDRTLYVDLIDYGVNSSGYFLRVSSCRALTSKAFKTRSAALKFLRANYLKILSVEESYNSAVNRCVDLFAEI